jgi:hypothetical protein
MERRSILLDRKSRIEAQLAAIDARARERDRKERMRRALLAGVRGCSLRCRAIDYTRTLGGDMMEG